ncbi:hypothetical protein BDM02DRAFT_3111230, partial [Thelephora ganbajun]
VFIYYKYWLPLGARATGRPQMPRLSSPPLAPMTLDQTLPSTGTDLQADDCAAVTGTGQVVRLLGVGGTSRFRRHRFQIDTPGPPSVSLNGWLSGA